MIMKPEEAIKYYNPPFEYNLHAQIILSKEESGKHVMHLCDIRGHGSLVGNTYNLNFEEAAKVQDAVGKFVAEAVNEKLTKPHVLTYEDLACEQGLELLTYLFGGYWQYNAIGLFRESGERGKYQDYINFDEPCDDELRADFGFVSLILAAALPDRDNYQVGYDWKLPNGEVVKAIFVPKT